MKTKIASWIKEHRNKMGINQQQLADKLGVSQPLISFWENEQVLPDHDMLEKLSAVLEADLDEKSLAIDLDEWLQKQREKLGLTRDQLAKKAGISPLTIYFIENGTTKSPQKATLKGLEKALGKLPSDLSKDVEKERDVGDFQYLGPFPINKWDENVDNGEIPCIYVFYDSMNRPVRIGETGDLRRRMKEYQQNYFWFRPPTAETFAYIIVKDPKFRSQAEKVMIKLVGQHAIFNDQNRI